MANIESKVTLDSSRLHNEIARFKGIGDEGEERSTRIGNAFKRTSGSHPDHTSNPITTNKNDVGLFSFGDVYKDETGTLKIKLGCNK